MEERLQQYEEQAAHYRSRIDQKYLSHMDDIKNEVGSLRRDQEDRDRRILQTVSGDTTTVLNKTVINMEDVKKANRNFTSLMAEFRNLLIVSEQSKTDLQAEK